MKVTPLTIVMPREAAVIKIRNRSPNVTILKNMVVAPNSLQMICK